jgi:hypothetical protein
MYKIISYQESVLRLEEGQGDERHDITQFLTVAHVGQLLSIIRARPDYQDRDCHGRSFGYTGWLEELPFEIHAEQPHTIDIAPEAGPPFQLDSWSVARHDAANVEAGKFPHASPVHIATVIASDVGTALEELARQYPVADPKRHMAESWITDVGPQHIRFWVKRIE